ncbi:AfsR/SARP family transcriptional regulator [Lentzea flava]|uniref:SARP family transcriptional regulator n=1 Tax=Lentzea flava TaxID=103732 RepID=A0ABQ2VDZ3_9PSEU|nr:BTAD domain-containing putative transcriptional regulator [Lentzea flava]MCP2204467.1 DNA-binding transcriptional activator of the SARP family [Lentzea flava]GGU78309.1 SARP family transcriptional regulator [Lentzea flava]
MRALVLGPIEVWVGDRQVGLGGPKPRTLLAALLLQPRQVVPVERLIDLIWDESPPQTAGALVHTYVSALRRAVGKALVTRAPGYLLDVDSDVEQFNKHLTTARQAERADDPATAITHYQHGLALWRGPALHGVDAQFARGHALALEESRLSAEEGLGRCELAQNRVEDAIARLTALANAHPAREDTRELLMRAFHRAGRQADALNVYRDAREHLLDELGIEPGEKLRDLQKAILNGTLEAAPRRTLVVATPPPVVTAQQVVPHHLPPDISDFTGREEALKQVLSLTEDAVGQDRTATPTVVVSGFGGAGKSALAVHAAHLLRKSYPDGQLFADLRGAGRDLEPQEVLGRFLGLLGIPGQDQPTAPDERVELYRRTVSDRRLVIVLDNARSEAQVRPLLPGNANCFVIITSRSRLTGLEGAEPIELGFFDSAVSEEMLSRVVGAERIGSEPEAAQRIAELCGGVPLALRAAAAKLLARPHWPLNTLAKRLSDERRRLDELETGDLAIRSSLKLNYSELDARHRKAFHLLALLDLPDFGAWIAAPLLDISPYDAEDVVEHLVDLRLVDVAGVDQIGRVRYRFHDLVQLFGAEQAAGEPAEEVTEAVTRTLATWLALVETGVKKLPRVTLGLRPPLHTEIDVDPRLRDDVEEDPTGWLHSETGAVVRAVERAHDLGVDELTTTVITSLLSSPFAARNEFGNWQRTHEVALRSARERGNRRAEAVLLAGLGQLRYEQDDFAAALTSFRQAAEIAAEIDEPGTLAVAYVGMGTVHRDLAEFERARELLDQAIALGDKGVVAAASYGVGAIHRDHGDLAEATRAFERCVELYREQDDQRGEGLALRGLSLCHRAAGTVGEAVALSREAERILREAGDELGATYAAQSLAKALLRAGELDGVDDLLTECLEVCTRQRDRFGIALMTRTLGEAALARGRDDDAAVLLDDALKQWTALGLPIWQARTMRDLAAATGDDEMWLRAKDLFAQVGAREAGELEGLSAGRWRSAL